MRGSPTTLAAVSLNADLAAALEEVSAGWPVILIDGPAGAGKTSLASQIAELLTPRTVGVIHLDDLYDGWDGLNGDLADYLSEEIEPQLRDGDEITHRRYDWDAGVFGDPVTLPATDVVILEGVGAGHPVLSDVADLLVWVEADADECRRRWLARDGPAMTRYAHHWDREQFAHFARHRTRERADVIVRTD